MLLSDVSCLVLGDDSVLFQVDLVTNDNNWRVLILHFVDTLNPVGNRLIRLLVGHVEAQDYSVRLTVKLVSYMSELFLTGRIPDFDLYFSIVLLIVVLGQYVVNCDSFEMTGDKFAFV